MTGLKIFLRFSRRLFKFTHLRQPYSFVFQVLFPFWGWLLQISSCKRSPWLLRCTYKYQIAMRKRLWNQKSTSLQSGVDSRHNPIDHHTRKLYRDSSVRTPLHLVIKLLIFEKVSKRISSFLTYHMKAQLLVTSVLSNLSLDFSLSILIL